MKINSPSLVLALTLAGSIAGSAHDIGAPHGGATAPLYGFPAQPPREFVELVLGADRAPAPTRRSIEEMAARYLAHQIKRPSLTSNVSEPVWFKEQPSRPGVDSRKARSAWAWPQAQAPQRRPLLASAALSPMSLGMSSLTFGALALFQAPTGNGALMAASFAPFKPRVRYYWDGTTFYEESDNMPDNAMMPNLMVGITSWQQQIPVPASYFANTTNPENSTSSLGYGQPNYWRLPLVPVPSASPIPISAGNFQRGAVAIAANGIAIFNPKNNTGAVSYAIGELDAYGGHCGLADDYHYHIIPTHLQSAFGGVLSNDKPVAWALDGYPIYGFVEPDGTARQTLDADGGHDIGSGWGYHYHAIGTTTVDGTHPYGTPQSPYLMSNFHGTVVNFGGQVDGQPEVGPIRASGTGGYTAVPVSGASIIAFKNPVALTTDGSGNLIENVSGTASADSYLMRVSISGTSYDECWKINRNVNPKTMTVTWRLAAATTTLTYTPIAGSAAGNRLAAYGMAAASQVKLPDTSQTLDTTATFGEDADYTINPQTFTDNGNGTITDSVTGLMWQKTDNGESTWDTAVTNAAGIATGGFTDWRLPTPSELFSIFNHNNGNPALNPTYFPNNSVGAADYWWTSDIYGSSTTNVWCSNAGGGLGGKPKSETISAGGVLRYSARYVRGAKPTNGHNYLNNGDGTITDLDMGLMWTQLPGASTTWDAALSYAENLSLGGFSDWRLPNVKELQTLTDYTLTTATSATGIKPSINRTMFAKTLTGCITTAGGTTITCADTTGLLAGMPLVDTADIAGTYLPTATPPTVATVTNATTFTVSSGTGIVAGSGLTLKALVPPTAYWSSTSLNNTTTRAWLVEFGINTSVLAANGPTRNSQGIISYEAKTSSYPVFAVRTASATTTAPPTITSITNATTMKNNATTALTFTVGDAVTPAASLTVSASSSNVTLVPVANIVFGGSGASRTVMVTPASGQVGTATITVTVSNGTTTTSATFTITVTPPNILLIIADDLGIDALSLYSSLLNNSGTGQFPPTPNIASLAANGVQFNHAYTYTVCSPSRSCILTGRFGYRTDTGNVVAGSSNNFLQATEFTLPRAFAANSALGYQLKHIGKWHLGGGNTAPGAIGGWPAFAGYLAGQVADYYSWPKVITDGTPGGTTTLTSTVYSTTDQVNDAVSFINTQTTAGKPWFATVAFNAPHVVSTAPLYQLPPTSLITAPYTSLSGTSADIAANPRNYFDAIIQAMDTEMGRLLASVDLAKTDVIFIGDNGTDTPVIQSPYSASHSKASLYEGGIRVPLIIRGPDVVSPGRTTDVLTHFVDLYSTILELAGINVAATVPAGVTIDSQSLLPVLNNTATTHSTLIYGEEFDIAFPTLGGRCLRNSQYKLIRKAAGVNLTTDEFYDLLADPYEATNLLAGGVAAMTTARQTAYNTLVTQLATFNTAPTISTIANRSTVQNTATSAIAFTVGDAEMSPTILTVTGGSSNTTLVPAANVVLGGAGASRTVTVTPATGQTGTSTITVNVTDGAFTTSTSFLLTVTAAATLPTITAIATTPASPTNLDSPWVNATIQAGSGATISTAQLTYSGGGTPTTSTVFTETMAATATAALAGWDGTGAINPWTITNTGGGAGNVKQTTAANHGTGNPCGLDMNKGSATATQTMVTTTNAINAVGTTGYVEFWVATTNLTAGLGWTFQLSTDGTTWTTRLSELTGSVHGYLSVFHYDLLAAERVSTLKMRFQFIGNGVGGPTAPSVQIDDIKVVTTTGSAAVTLSMIDDGLHNDGAAGDGVYGAQIPAQTTGTTVTYTVAATDSNSATTTSSSASYTVGTATPVLAVTPATGLTSSGNAGGAFSPSSATYTLTNSGTGTMSWTAGKTAAWLTLSASSGTLAAGASTTVSATINTAANSLTAASYSDTITFTNSTNANGNTTRAVSLTVNATSAPAAPVLPTLATVTAGTTITLTWPAVSGATSYTLEIASSANFSTSLLASQTVTSPTAGFNSLTGGVTYYYRVIATNSIGSSTYSNTVFSTQDTSAPTVVITSPATGTSTATATIAVSGTSSGATSVKVNNVAATSANGFATWTATVPLGFGTNSITATATNSSGTSVTSAAVTVTLTAAQTYNPLIIPDTISGTTFNLSLNQKTKQFRTGAATTTYAYNGALMWGPTLIMNKGDAVQMNVTNNLIDTTTMHWHGFHIPAIMDGGPHQTVPAGTTWSPSWTVKNDAATYWYHPHLHGTTMEQLVKGAGGFIIVRDPQEAALGLPRTYGVDDIPLALTSRRFLTSNQFSYDHLVDNYGDYMLVNGTLTPQVSLPKQYVRMRILNAEVARGYNLGFSDNRTFYVIANDQGLLDAPVAVTRVKLMVGERVEIMVYLGNDTLGSSFELKAYNSGQVFGFPGQEGNPTTPTGNAGPVNGSLLNNTDFNILHINVAAATASPITALPATLVPQTYWTNANVTNTRAITLTGGNGGSEFTFNNISYTPTLFNHTIALNAIEKWSISNNAGAIFGHSIHIHDIKFNIIARSPTSGQVSTTGLAATYESGWKDTLYVPKGETVDVIAKFDDFASNTNPFMFHCHFLQHEDGGMMGQFLVVNSAVEDLAIASFTRTGANSDISLQFKSTVGTTYTLQYSADMTTSSWTDIGSVTSNGASAIFTETAATRLAQPKGFYRVKIPAIP